MLNVEELTRASRVLPEVEALYLRAFPAQERRPFDELLDAEGAQRPEMLAFTDEHGRFCGLAFLLYAVGLAHLIYFAVDEALRGQGVGTQMLALLDARTAGTPLMADIELPGRGENRAQRARRKQFYLRCGYTETGVRYDWKGERYEVLCRGGTVSRAQYHAFWEALYGKPKPTPALHNIAPVCGDDARVLILGSFPSVKSREEAFFYAHPQNRFWPVLAAVLSEPTPTDVAQKRAMLLGHRVALWDVIGACEIVGSSDASIRGAQPNDLRPLLERAPIGRIFCNGGTAFRAYQRLTRPVLGIEAQQLPSTSPANARWSRDALTEAWRAALTPWL